jgi:hypothetical protein
MTQLGFKSTFIGIEIHNESGYQRRRELRCMVKRISPGAEICQKCDSASSGGHKKGHSKENGSLRPKKFPLTPCLAEAKSIRRRLWIWAAEGPFGRADAAA